MHAELPLSVKSVILLLLICWFPGVNVLSQEVLTGQQTTTLWDSAIPFITTYTAEEYGGDSQNWDFTQLDNGIIYVANSAGILEFDGVSWNLIPTSNSGSVRSLAKDENGIVYVGGSREIGYLKTGENGRVRYQSLLPELNSDYHDFTDVWSTYALRGAIYFISPQYILKWENKKFKVLHPSKSFGKNVILNGELFIIDRNVGLKLLKNDSLHLVSDSTLSSNLTMLPFDKEKIFIVDNSKGSFVYEPYSYPHRSYIPSPLFKGKEGYYGINLPDGNYLMATLGSGVFIFDKNREVKSNLTKEHGLASNVIYSAFEDNEGAVWLGTANGISRIEISSPLREFDQRSGINEGVIVTAFHQGKLYAGCFNELLVSDLNGANSGDKKGTFHTIGAASKIQEPFSLLSAEEGLWVGEFGISLLQNEKLIQFLKPDGEITHGYKVIKSQFDPDKLYAVNSQGQLYQIIKQNNGWTMSKPIIDINARIHHFIEDSSGALWFATYVNGIHKVKGITNGNKNSQGLNTIQYDTLKGLPGLTENSILLVNGNIYSGTKRGLYKYQSKRDSFVRDSSIDQFFPNIEYFCGLIAKGYDESLWIPTYSALGTKVFKFSKNGKVKEIPYFHRNSNLQIYNINASQKGLVLISGPKGITAYNDDVDQKAPSPLLNLRHVRFRNDSIFGGSNEAISQPVEFDYQWNDLRFEYALASYNDISSNQYQSQLVGYDPNWSVWSSETKKEYTNLPEGNYTFKVRGKNIFDQISKDISYTFIVRPPWYRTWWAFLVYLLGAVLLIWIFVYWRSRQLRHKNLVLEALVNERTEEIRQKNNILALQAEKLTEMDTMKTRLFANISHEFRTPLTLIKGPIEKLEAENENTITTFNVNMIRRNANRLLNLVNQLLDLSKLDSGKLQLNTAEGDVFRCLRAAASSFSSHAASRLIDYQIKIPSRLLWATFDRDKLEKIIYNLLSNAFKFTDDGGRIILDINYRGTALELVVSDSGHGIHKDKLPHIFDRFFQVDDSYTKEKSGSGIGLALTNELVDLMEGNIYVESEVEKGSKFRVVIPMEAIRSRKTLEKEELATTSFDDDPDLVEGSGETKKDITVLIIEDNNDMRHFIKEQLVGDYEILEAPNGNEGFRMAIKSVPDLIITDLMMPQMDGITLCKKLKTKIETSHIPVIMLTAKAGIENKLEGLEIGADDYLTKPFNAKELQIRTKNLIAQRRQLRELFSKDISLDPKEITVTSLDEEFVKRVVALLEEHHTDSEFGVPQMQMALAMSKTQLHNKIKALTNHPPGELLRTFRLKRAAQLLRQPNENITQVAYDVGFNSLSYFTKCFKEYYGKSPTDYMRQTD